MAVAGRALTPGQALGLHALLRRAQGLNSWLEVSLEQDVVLGQVFCIRVLGPTEVRFAIREHRDTVVWLSSDQVEHVEDVTDLD